MRRCTRLGLVSLVLGLAWTRVPAAQATPWVEDWLKEYASGKRVDVVERLKATGNLAQLQSDLDRLLPEWIARKGVDPVASRRTIAAFALEAAMTHVDQASSASKLVEWGCRQIRRDPKPDEFDRLWHLAAFAALEGAADADGIESHITHVKFQFPSEPRLALARGVAEELRIFEGMTRGRASAGDLAKHGEEAVRRFQDAMADVGTRGEAGLRQGHALLQLGTLEQALEVLGHVESATKDADFIYLARLFRGRALDRLARTDDARRAYLSALEVRPGGATATLSLAALLFRRGLRDDAGVIMENFLGRSDAQDDPWWSYWPGDFRLAERLAGAMREALK
jgi:tetratricopeptide (TPR) repeat protein